MTARHVSKLRFELLSRSSYSNPVNEQACSGDANLAWLGPASILTWLSPTAIIGLHVIGNACTIGSPIVDNEQHQYQQAAVYGRESLYSLDLHADYKQKVSLFEVAGTPTSLRWPLRQVYLNL